MSISKIGHTFTFDVIEKFRYNCSTGIVGMKGKKHSEETKLKMSKSMLGKKLSKETIEKISKRTNIEIFCVENNIVYESIKDASIKLNINRDKISLCLNRQIESYGGYHFNYINKPKEINKVCVNCGKEYIAQRKNSLCCDYKCSVQHSRKKKNSN